MTETGTPSDITVTAEHDAAIRSGNKERIELLEINLKNRQIAKTDLEIAQLQNFWPRLLEAVQKVAVPVLVLGSAIVAVILGIPQAKLDLSAAEFKTREAEKRAEAARRLSDEAEMLVERSDMRVAELRVVQTNLEQSIVAQKRELAAADAATKEANERIKVSPQGIDQVFVQFKGEITRDTINGLRAALSAAGFKVPPAERIDRNQKNMVKYFSSSPEEKTRATKVAANTKEFFAKQLCPIGDVAIEKVERRGGKTAPIELWLDHTCKTTRP